MNVFKKPEIHKHDITSQAGGDCGLLVLDDGGLLVLDDTGFLIIGPDCSTYYSPWESSIFRSKIFMSSKHLARPENI